MIDPESARTWLYAAGAASPWLLAPVVVSWRARGSRSLDDEVPNAPPDAPLVSVVVPARDEARNIGRCVRAILATTYPRLELIVVDDHSTDGTAALARDAFAGDTRARVIDAPPLAEGWFGKQWACAAGARESRGALLLFADADTVHASDLVARAVNAHRRDGGLLTVVGRQELGSFWERVVQPQVLAILLARYGGTERVNRSRRTVDKIANGQFLLFDRETYDAIGGHASVRDVVAEDLKLAQRTFASGHAVRLVAGEAQLTTRMYASLDELVRGWRKNVYAGGRDAMPGGRVGRVAFPLLLALLPLLQLVPAIALGLALTGFGGAVVARAAILASAATLVFWAATYRRLGVSIAYAVLAPLGTVVLLGIIVQAIARGQRVEWRGREYLSGSANDPNDPNDPAPR